MISYRLPRIERELRDPRMLHVGVEEDGEIVAYLRLVKPAPVEAGVGKAQEADGEGDVTAKGREEELPEGTNLELWDTWRHVLEAGRGKWCQTTDWGEYRSFDFPHTVSRLCCFFYRRSASGAASTGAKSKSSYLFVSNSLHSLLLTSLALHSLATLPIHRGKGLASMLLEHGAQLLDSRNGRCYLEATDAAYRLYLKYGWKQVEKVEIDLSRFGGEERLGVWYMIREPQRQ
jgi:GNAT superfamily N-acetyltransferase